VRARLLRALAHLKAARAHLKAARFCLDWKDSDPPKRAMEATLPALVEAEKVMLTEYANAVGAAVKAAKVTPNP
jgi:hypothetical protein